MMKVKCRLFFFLFVLLCNGFTSIPAQSQPLETVIQTGHSGYIEAVAFSPDGKLAAIAGTDGTPKLWEVATGREIRSFKGHTGTVESIAFSPDGMAIVSGGSDKTVRLWNISTGRELRLFSGHTETVASVAFSPDGRTILSGDLDGNAKLWDTGNGYEIRTVKGQNTAVKSVDYCLNGQTYITAGNDMTVRLWDAATGNLLQTFTDDTDWIECAAISPDGQLVASGREGLVKIWDTSTGQVITSMTFWSHTIESVAFHPSGQLLAVGSHYEAGVYNIGTGEKINHTVYYHERIHSIAFSPDGNTFLTGSMDGTARLWDATRSGGIEKEIRIFHGNAASVNSVSFNSDGSHIAVGNEDAIARIWDLSLGHAVHSLTGHQYNLTDVTFSPDGRTLATAAYDKKVKLWDVPSGRELRTFTGHQDWVFSVNFSRDGKLIAGGSRDCAAELWNVSTGMNFRSIEDHPDWIYAVDFTYDGTGLITAGMDKTARLWDIHSGTELRIFRGHSNCISSASVSPSGRFLLTGSWDQTAKLWNINTGLEYQSYTGHDRWINAVAFSPNGRIVATAGSDDTARLWDTESGRVLRVLRGHAGAVTSVSFSPDGRHILTGSTDGSMKLWDIGSGTQLVTMISLNENDWAVVNPSGFFDCSDGAKGSIHFVQGLQIYELDQFFEDFYRPGLLSEIFKGSVAGRPEISVADKISQAPPPVVRIVRPDPGVTRNERTQQVAIKVTDTGGGIDEVVLLHNGKRISESQRGTQLIVKGKDTYKGYVISLLDGENILSASAFSEGRVESKSHNITVYFSGSTGMVNCYLYTVGIDQYTNPQYHLNYARADAVAIASLIRQKSTGIFNDIFSTQLLDSNATGETIRSYFQAMARNVRPEDVFAFFYAGHGVMLPDETGKEQFYLVPAEVTNMYSEDQIRRSSISGTELVELSRNIKARKQLFIFDACQSGSISDAFAVRGAAEHKALAQLARSAGVHIVASTQSDQFATEFSQLGHGLFTYALLQAAGGAADGSPEDGTITVREINAYLESTIPELSRQYRGKPQYPVIFSKGQDFPVVVK